MTWFKMDDQFPRHPKVLRAGTDAAWLFVAGGCYCAQYLTDGLIPKDALTGLTGLRQPAKLAQRLIDSGLWHDADANYEVHDYLNYNPSREHVEEERRKALERRTKGGRRSRDVRAKDICPDPTRPEVLTELVEAPQPKTRGCRVPLPFEVTPVMEKWAIDERPDVDWQEQTRRFVDHWKAQPGQKGVKADWPATWRNWIRNAR